MRNTSSLRCLLIIVASSFFSFGCQPSAQDNTSKNLQLLLRKRNLQLLILQNMTA
jgi:hypothetical protein